MTPRKGFLVAAVAVLSAAVAAGQDAAESPPGATQMAVRAHLDRPLRPSDGPPSLVAFTTGVPPEICLPASVRCESTQLTGTVAVARPDAPGVVVLTFGSSGRGLTVLAFRKRMRDETDLGEIALGDAAPVLVSGTVKDADGVPASGARVTVTATAAGSMAWGVGDALCTVDGRFVLRGIVRGEDVTLKVAATGSWVSPDVPAAPGSADVAVVARRSAGACGTLELPAGLDPAEFEVVVNGVREGSHGLDVDGSGSWSRRGTTLRFRCDDTRFRVRGLQPGPYDFGLRFRGAAQFLARLTGVRIENGTTELPPLTIDRPVRRIALRVRSADGGAVAGARAWAREGGDEGGYRTVRLDDQGTAWVATFADRVSLAACGEGTEFAFATCESDTADLTVPAGKAVAVALTPGDGFTTLLASLVERDATVTLAWAAPPDAAELPASDDDDDARDPRMSVKESCPLPAAGSAVLRVAVPGLYRVGVHVARDGRATEFHTGSVRVDGTADVAAKLDLGRVSVTGLGFVDGPKHPQSGLRGTLDLPPELDLADLVLVVAGPAKGVEGAVVGGSGTRTSSAGRVEFPARSPFDVTNLGPGTYEVRLKFRGSSAFLARAQGVEVGDSIVDVGALRVTAEIRHVAVRCVLPDGADAHTLVVWARGATDRGGYHEIAVGEDGAAHAVYVGDRVSIAAHAAGTAFVFVTTSDAEATLTLPAAPRTPATFRLPGEVPKSALDLGLHVHLTWCAPPDTPNAAAASAFADDSDPRSAKAIEVPFAPAGTATTAIDVPGWYRVSIGLKREGSSTRQAIDLVRVAGPDAVSADLDLSADRIERMVRDF